ncbi:sodium ABC transporter ATP-binding protein [Pueribacillus theae]|uniref:Sodium ABC transporter ATP-binding protein n=1 Tax=Pueribacillus theae TaxID=2171751 RepID=A0A2U1JZ46_9BACI|nr:ABC transporter ATP-binding protein [Pueribacillus theae]PWA10068.1 sodium ABC transporter ATP-binding protein [Pueribacillus theae]
MENCVQVRNVSKDFGGFSLKDISFDIKQGFITGLIGPNGAGKSTTIRCLMNLINIDHGEIQLFGKTHESDTKEIKQRIGYVSDENYYYEELSIEKNKRIIAPFYETWNDDAFYRYLKMFNLPAMKQVKKLSKGMKIKFALAMALAHDPELIIMDEPTSGLDPIFRRELLDLLLEILQDEKKAVFFSTHITTDLEQIADYITFINDGKIVFSKEKEEIMEQYAIVKGARTYLADIRNQQVVGFKETDVGFECLMVDRKQIPSELKQSLAIEKPTLEEIMYYTVRGNKVEGSHS